MTLRSLRARPFHNLPTNEMLSHITLSSGSKYVIKRHCTSWGNAAKGLLEIACVQSAEYVHDLDDLKKQIYHQRRYSDTRPTRRRQINEYT